MPYTRFLELTICITFSILAKLLNYMINPLRITLITNFHPDPLKLCGTGDTLVENSDLTIFSIKQAIPYKCIKCGGKCNAIVVLTLFFQRTTRRMHRYDPKGSQALSTLPL